MRLKPIHTGTHADFFGSTGSQFRRHPFLTSRTAGSDCAFAGRAAMAIGNALASAIKAIVACRAGVARRERPESAGAWKARGAIRMGRSPCRAESVAVV